MKIPIVIIAALAGGASMAIAAPTVINQATAVIRNDFGEYGGGGADQEFAIDQSGLSSNYISGVTDYTSFIASHTLSYNGNEWFDTGSGFAGPGFFDIDLGQTLSLTNIALWNEEVGGIGNLDIYVSNDSLFGSSTFVGNFTLTDNLQGSDYFAQDLDITDASGRYVRLYIRSVGINSTWNGVSMGEIAFGSNSIPLPSGAALAGLGLLGVGVRRRRVSL